MCNIFSEKWTCTCTAHRSPQTEHTQTSKSQVKKWNIISDLETPFLPLLVRKELMHFYFIQMKLCRCVFFTLISNISYSTFCLWESSILLPMVVTHSCCSVVLQYLNVQGYFSTIILAVLVMCPLLLGMWVASNMLLSEYCRHKHSNTFLFWKHVDISLGLLDHNTSNM